MFLTRFMDTPSNANEYSQSSVCLHVVEESILLFWDTRLLHRRSFQPAESSKKQVRLSRKIPVGVTENMWTSTLWDCHRDPTWLNISISISTSIGRHRIPWLRVRLRTVEISTIAKGVVLYSTAPQRMKSCSPGHFACARIFYFMYVCMCIYMTVHI